MSNLRAIVFKQIQLERVLPLRFNGQVALKFITFLSLFVRGRTQVPQLNLNRVVHGSHFQAIFGSFSASFLDHFHCLAVK